MHAKESHRSAVFNGHLHCECGHVRLLAGKLGKNRRRTSEGLAEEDPEHRHRQVPNKHKIPGIRTLQESCPLSYTYSPSNFTTNDRRVFSREETHSLAGRNMMLIRRKERVQGTSQGEAPIDILSRLSSPGKVLLKKKKV